MTFTSRWLEWQPDASQSAKNALAPRSELPELTEHHAEVTAEEVLSVLAVHLTGEAVKTDAEPLAPPAPRELPSPPVPGWEPVILTAEDLAPVPGSPHADLEADWRTAQTMARKGYAAHGGAPGGRDAHKFTRDAATLELLLVTREREFATWRERWRATLEGVYAGKVALMPGLERDLLATWRPRLPAEDDGVRICRDCGGEFQRPAALPAHVPAQRCKACAEVPR